MSRENNHHSYCLIYSKPVHCRGRYKKCDANYKQTTKYRYTTTVGIISPANSYVIIIIIYNMYILAFIIPQTYNYIYNVSRSKIITIINSHTCISNTFFIYLPINKHAKQLLNEYRDYKYFFV